MHQLEEIREVLSRPDAIIDSNIVSSLRSYPALCMKLESISNSSGSANKQESLKKYLSEGQTLLVNNYRGYTKSCNLLLDWMKNIQDAKTIHNTFISALKSSALEIYEERLAQNSQTEMMQIDEEDDENERESKLEKYKQRIFASIDEITQSYGDTAVLQRGFSLSEFEEKLVHHLYKIVQSASSLDYDKRCQRLITYCCKNELYYLYTRRLLAVLRENERANKLDYVLANIEAKLDEYTNSMGCANSNSSNHQHRSMLSGIAQNVNLSDCSRILELSIYAKGVEFECNELRVPSMELLRKGSFTKADISKVYHYYYSHFIQQKRKRVALRFLENEHMIDYLYQTLFIPPSSNAEQQKMNKTYMSQFIFLLNYALFDEHTNHEDSNSNHNNGSTKSESEDTVRKEFDANMKMLTSVTEICRDPGYALTLSENAEKQNMLFSGIKQPGIARGILIWINHSMYIECDKYFAESFETYLTPLLVSLIAEIARLHIFLRGAVAKFAYNMIYNIGDQTTSTLSTKSAASFSAKDTAAESMKNLKVIATMLDISVFLVQLGEYHMVFDLIHKRYGDLKKLDRSLHRHFVTQIINTCLPPLPADFVSSFCKLLKDANILAAIKNDQSTAKLVAAFVETHRAQHAISQNDAQIILSNI